MRAVQGGGAISMGLDDFRTSASCVAPAPAPTAVAVTNCTFRGNVAKLQGGAISQQSGSLSIRVPSPSPGQSLRAVQPDGVVLINCFSRPAALKPQSKSSHSLCSGPAFPASGLKKF